jgi:ubiquitin carboxyl-terminal hydrolase 22/27/51
MYKVNTIDYKPHTIPSYVLTRETEAVHEKEMERKKELARIKEFEEALLATIYSIATCIYPVLIKTELNCI